MSAGYVTAEEQGARHRNTRVESLPEHDGGAQAERNGSRIPLYSHTLSTGGRGNAPVRAALLHSAQQARGNRAVQRLARGMGRSSSEPLLRGQELSGRIGAASSVDDKLDAKTRERLEESVGADLSNVRVHTGAEADLLSRSVGATAFTTGRDIFFRSGAYNPYSSDGLRVLAHEVTHTVQQAEGPVDGTPTRDGLRISEPSDRFEQAAWRVADSVVSGKGTGRSLAPSPGNADTATAVSSCVGGAGIAVQRAGPFDSMFPEQEYDTPTPEEIEEAERLAQQLGKEQGFEWAKDGAEAGAEDAAAAGETAAATGETAAAAGETAAVAGETATVAGETAAVAGEGAAAGAGGLGAGAILPLAAAGVAGFGLGTAIGKYGIDPYLNRPHMEDASASDNYKDTWAYKINQWLDN